MWKFYTLLSALFAALTAIFAKIGVANVNAHLATAIRTTVVLLLAWGIVFATGHAGELKGVGARVWIFLILSGIATGLSWIFYFHALQTGDASRVAPIPQGYSRGRAHRGWEHSDDHPLGWNRPLQSPSERRGTLRRYDLGEMEIDQKIFNRKKKKHLYAFKRRGTPLRYSLRDS